MRLTELLAEHPELDCEVELAPDDYVSDVVLLARCVQLADNTDALVVSTSEHTTGMVQHGIVRSALIQLEDMMLRPERYGDDGG